MVRRSLAKVLFSLAAANLALSGCKASERKDSGSAADDRITVRDSAEEEPAEPSTARME